MPNYEKLSSEVSERIEQDMRDGTRPSFAAKSADAVRRDSTVDKESIWRPAYLRDVDKIMHSPYYNRYTDKTQVFSFYKNDDITRRALHVQLVSRIARTIGRALHLNLDLIEAIALGHDIGHPAFAHTGERLLDELYYAHTGRRFLHNIHSVRVLDKIHPYNLTLETLNGIATHNGELELAEYHPVPVKDFSEFDTIMEKCTMDRAYADKIMPSTLEGAVVRISDIIAYLGKDRQDAILAKAATEEEFASSALGTGNAEIVNNLIVNIIENSYGKPYIKLDDAHFNALREAKKENYEKIYDRATQHTGLRGSVERMMRDVYGQLLADVKADCRTSPIFTHHVAQVTKLWGKNAADYDKTEANQLVVDYIASMTDDYFIELHEFLFPGSCHGLRYRGYFDE